MAVGYNTSIVTNGLRLYLDAGNPKSYTFGENLLLYSQEIDTFPWQVSSGSTVTPNAAIAPDGTNTADQVNAVSWVLQSISATVNTTYTFSVWLRSATGSNQSTSLVIEDNGTGGAVVASLAITITNQWQRFSLTGTSLNPTSIFRPSVRAGNYYMWGAQLERSPTANKYVPTTTSALTGSTTWTDLSGNGFNATLVNPPTFTSENNGCFIFDGVNDYASFTNPLNQTQLNQEWTVQSWINITTKPPQTLIAGLNDGLFIEYVQGNNSLLYLNQGANDYYTYGGQFTAQGWVLATFRFNNSNGNREIWSNRTNISTSGPNFTNTPSGQSGTFTLGVNGSNTILGRVSTLFMYNRYLTDTEVEQNFGALRGRYSV